MSGNDMSAGKDPDMSPEEFSINKRLHEIVLESIGTGILAVDLDGNILTMNKAAEEMYAYPRELAIGNSFLFGLAEHERARFLKTHNYVVKTEDVFRGDVVELVNCAGETVFINAYSSLIKDPDGQKLGVAMLTENITEKKKMEQLVRRADKMAALGQLALGLSHQIRTPLGAIKALAALIKSDHPGEENTIKYLNIIFDEVDRLNDLSQKLLDFSGDTYLLMETVDINVVLNKAAFLAKLNRPQALIVISQDLQNRLTPIIADKELLTHVMMNLILNAMDAIDRKGTVQIESVQENGWIVVKITDTGKGIAPEAIEKIFNPFYTDKDNGTGLGLSIVHNIIAEHKGHVEVESQLGKGTTFTIKLPVGKGG